MSREEHFDFYGKLQHMGGYIRALGKWTLLAVLVGGSSGIIGSLFHIGVSWVTELRAEHPWLLLLLPAAGLLIVAMYRAAKLDGVGTNAVIDAVHEGKNIPWLLLPGIFIGTILTHLCGGSAGREGAALQMGGDIGRHMADLLHLDDKDRRLATICGMSAGNGGINDKILPQSFGKMKAVAQKKIFNNSNVAQFHKKPRFRSFSLCISMNVSSLLKHEK